MGDDGVSEGSQSVHPRGNPCSHSTHVGFSCPPCARFTALPSVFVFWFGPAPRQSPAAGVGYRPVPPSPLTQSVSDTPGWALLEVVLRLPAALESPAVGVGNDEHSISDMRGTDRCCRKTSPPRIEPCVGQTGEYIPEQASAICGKQSWYVFQQHPSWV